MNCRFMIHPEKSILYRESIQRIVNVPTLRTIKKWFIIGGWVRLKMVRFECPRVTHPSVSSTYEGFPFPIFFPCSFLPSSLPIIKKWFIMGGWVKRWTYF